MSGSEFQLAVAPGFFVDDQGRLVRSPDRFVPQYSTGHTNAFDPEAIQKAFAGVAKAIPDPDDPNSRSKLLDLGLADDLIDILGGIRKVAEIASKVFIVASVAVELLKIIGIFRDGPSALELKLDREFAQLRAQSDAFEQRVRESQLDEHRLRLRAALTDVQQFAQNVSRGTYSATAEASLRQNMQQNQTDVLTSVLFLLRAQNWTIPFARSQHTAWQFIPNLYFVPPIIVDPSKPPPRVQFPQDDISQMLNCGLVVSEASYAVQSYLTFIATLVPEYRSTSEFRSELELIAKSLEELAAAVRTSVLARTEHQASDFTFLMPAEVFENPITRTAHPNMQAARRFPVGAVDLLNHTNAYYNRIINSQSSLRNPDPAVLGTLTRYWRPPASLFRVGQPGEISMYYLITNSAECAAEANKLATAHYLDLLYASGYLTLLHLTASVRHNMTEPARSQTVSGVSTRVCSDIDTKESVEVRADRIPLSPPITAMAERQPRRSVFNASITTQPVERGLPLEYSITLRTFHSIGTNYEDFYSAGYHQDTEPDASASTNSLLVSMQQPQSEFVVHSSTGPLQTLRGHDTVTLKATTFDWWIPTRSIAQQFAAQGRLLIGSVPRPRAGARRIVGSKLRSGGTGASTRTMTRSPEPLMRVDDLDRTWWPEAFAANAPDPRALGGQQRDVGKANVRLEYEFEWLENKLRISLKSRPEDRNYVVFVVVEERMARSGKWIHTAFPFAAEGSLTFVPAHFFEREQAAKDHARKVLSDIALRHSIFTPVGPQDPVVSNLIRPGDMISDRGLSALAEAVRLKVPVEWKQLLAKKSRTPTSAGERTKTRNGDLRRAGKRRHRASGKT